MLSYIRYYHPSIKDIILVAYSVTCKKHLTVLIMTFF